MRSSTIDRITVITLASATQVWAACLVILWATALDASGMTTLLALSAMLMAISAASVLPARVAGLLQRFSGGGDDRDKLVITLALDGPHPARSDDARAIVRFLALATLLGVAAMGLSSLAIFGVGHGVKNLSGWAMLSWPGWAVLRWLILWICFLPLGLGASVMFLASAMVRTGSGRDVYAQAIREWIWAAACAGAIFGGCWILGVDLAALSAMMAVVLVGIAMLIFQRREFTRRPQHIERSVEFSPLRRRMGIAATFAVVVVVAVSQLRLLNDSTGISMGLSGVWLAVSAALLAGFLRWADHKSRPPGRTQRIGANLGIALGVGLQAGLWITAVAGGWTAGVCMFMGCFTQISILALAAVVISRQRRRFAEVGGRARAYWSSAMLGGGLGLAGYAGVLAIPGGLKWLLLGGLLLCSLAIVVSVMQIRRTEKQGQWALWGVGALLTLAMAILGGWRTVVSQTGPLRAGVWLSGISRMDEAGRYHAWDVLPLGNVGRSAELSQALKRLMANTGGHWLAAVLGREDIPASLESPYSRISLTVSLPDPGEIRGRQWREPGMVSCEKDTFAGARINPDRFTGILLAGVPADHPEAWRFYNLDYLRDQLRRLNPQGVAAMRIRSGRGGCDRALAAARTFQRALGASCWVAVSSQGEGAELLVVGPADQVRLWVDEETLPVVQSEQLWYEWPGTRTIRVNRPYPIFASGPRWPDFLARIEHLRVGRKKTAVEGFLPSTAGATER